MDESDRYIKISVNELEVGMYVSELDRPWIDTPFLVEGFYIEGQDDIDQLQELCQWVRVNPLRVRLHSRMRTSRFIGQPSRARSSPGRPVAPQQRTFVAGNTGAQFAARRLTKDESVFAHRKLTPYVDQSSADQELGPARKAYNRVLANFTESCDAIRAGRGVDFSWVREAIVPLIQSIVRNPDGAVWYTRIKDQAGYHYRHAVSSAVWCAALGREIGLPQQELVRLAIGGLLLDVGKFALDSEVLDQTGKLGEDESELIMSHVPLGMVLVRETSVASHAVLEMIGSHHERFDGHGYPGGLAGEQIPLYGRIAAIIDCYDAMTSDRGYAKGMAPSEAVKQLYALRAVDFQTELVELFIKAIGLYPAGTLVELSDARVGVVLSGYRQHKLRPNLLLLLDQHKQPFDDPCRLDMKSADTGIDGQPLTIVRSLEPGAYGLDQERI